MTDNSSLALVLKAFSVPILPPFRVYPQPTSDYIRQCDAVRHFVTSHSAVQRHIPCHRSEYCHRRENYKRMQNNGLQQSASMGR